MSITSIDRARRSLCNLLGVIASVDNDYYKLCGINMVQN